MPVDVAAERRKVGDYTKKLRRHPKSCDAAAGSLSLSERAGAGAIEPHLRKISVGERLLQDSIDHQSAR